MGKSQSFAAALLLAALALLCATPCRSADLTPTETRWLQGAWPVIAYARQSGIPFDIVVQPQPSEGVAPLSMAYINERCTLVLSMRGNPEADATLQRLAPEEPAVVDATLELMAAHELGHCHRYLVGAWFKLPAGFIADRAASGDATSTRREQNAAERREEGYGDLVGLAWTRSRHPALYPRLHAWLMKERETGRVPGSPHDTMAWVGLAADGARFGTDPSLFRQAWGLWQEGAH